METINEVEDELTAIPYNPEKWREDGRLYPPMSDRQHPVPGYEDVTRFRSRDHNTFIRNNGAIEIVGITKGQTEFKASGADGKGVWE